MKKLVFIFSLFIVSLPIKSYAVFNYVTTHPYTPTQTQWGKRIYQLHNFNGKIYAAYGDSGANTGPLRLCYIEPPSSSFVCDSFIFHTETLRYVTLNGKLYAVALDPHGPINHAYAVNSGNNWSAKGVTAFHNLGSPLHFSSMGYNAGALFIGSDQWVVPNQYPTVWKSTNGGNTWSSSYELPSVSLGQFWFLQSYNGKLYTDHGTLSQSKYTTNGSSWLNGPIMQGTVSIPGQQVSVAILGRTTVFSDNIVSYSGRYSSVAGINRLHPYYYVSAYAVNGNHLYALTQQYTTVPPHVNRKVYQTDDLISWQYVDDAPDNSISIEVGEGAIYVGTDEGKIYKSDKVVPVSTAFIVPPIMLLLD